MNRVRIVLSFVIFTAGGVAAAAQEPSPTANDDAQERPSPDIVVIYADDLGYGDVQCYSSERGKIPTPNIDLTNWISSTL
jgi:hypothetical protein